MPFPFGFGLGFFQGFCLQAFGFGSFGLDPGAAFFDPLLFLVEQGQFGEQGLDKPELFFRKQFPGFGLGGKLVFDQALYLEHGDIVIAALGVDAFGQGVVLDFVALFLFGKAQDTALGEGFEYLVYENGVEFFEPPAQLGLGERLFGAFQGHKGREHLPDGFGILSQAGSDLHHLLVEKIPEYVADIAQAVERLQGEGGFRLPRLVAGNTHVELVEKHLQIGQFDAEGLFPFLDFFKDALCNGLLFAAFQADVAVFQCAHAQDNLFYLVEVHRLYPQFLALQLGQFALEIVKVAQVFFPDGEDDFDRQLHAQDFLHIFDKGILFCLVPDGIELFELVKDQINRLEMLPIYGLQQAGQGGGSLGFGPGRAWFRKILVEPVQGIGFPGFLVGTAGLLQGLKKGFVEVAAPADIQGQPVVALEPAGQSALDQAGLANARRALHQEQVGLENQLIECLDLFVAAKKDVLVFACIGIEEFKRVAFLHGGRGLEVIKIWKTRR